jgi:predicted alpha/beta-fold hydrolase
MRPFTGESPWERTWRRLPARDNAANYYQQNSACYWLDDICTPTLLIHAADDPVVDIEVFLPRDWTNKRPLYAALAESGGHTGFLDRDGNRWHEECAVRFFDWRRLSSCDSI